MIDMREDDVQHLARLARLAITNAEATRFTAEIDAILQSVSVISEVASTAAEPTVGPVHNVFREDVVCPQPEAQTEALLAAWPERVGRFMKVKKILSADD